MAAAGLAADSLPMSFGSKKKKQNGSTNSNNNNNNNNRKKCKRVVDDDDDENVYERHFYRSTAIAASTYQVPIEPTKMEKVHVKYDSDGEVAERVVEAVEQFVPEAAEANPVPVDESPTGEHTEGALDDVSATAVVQPDNLAQGVFSSCLIASMSCVRLFN